MAKPVTTTTWLTTVFLIVFAFVYFQVGRWLRALNPKARIPATLLSVLGLFGFPVGTLIGLYVLYLLHSKKGVMVFSPEYRQVIEATPQIRYRTSLLAWLFLGLIVLALMGLIAGGLTLAPKS
jgi:succinate dehydrogenase/fumarate reductase cytochrome b subunit